MITRDIEQVVLESIQTFPSITFVDPRQSGETNLVKKLFPDFAYFNLENPDERLIATEDPS